MPLRHRRRSWFTAVLLLACAGVDAQEPEACAEGNTRLPTIVNVRIDNDLLGKQDQGYSNGIQLTLVTPNLHDYIDDPCVPGPARWINRYLDALQPAHDYEQRNMIATFAQGIFTPSDFSRSDVIEDDRPYAAALLAGLGYNARQGDRLRTTQLQVGVVGPAALGKQVQNAVHRITGSDRFKGWDHQLRNEPVFRIVHERMRRFPHNDHSGGWGWDAITHYGGSFGNLATYANGGAELRFGLNLPDDFGSTPLRPAGENTAPTREQRTYYTSGVHAFITFDASWVLYDITLDGNTFRESHSVNKREAVGYVGYGIVLARQRWKFALARYHGTRQFDGQRETPVFGSFTVSRAF